MSKETFDVELKPCPFCGGKADIKKGLPQSQSRGGKQFLIQCRKCGCRTVLFRQSALEPWKELLDACVSTWNRRVKDGEQE